ncbi:MAG: Hpt domain-containing protein [Planctomycetaceae bacterium]|jgi:HPt (histidine-containing phosphotransfer) domain-containing protein|nr:Hpt domain-containing protein [Planctomycetaceae bacterium]
MNTEHSFIYSDLALDKDLREILTMYVEEMPDKIVRLERECAERNWLELRTAAHQLKGSAGSHGFAEISLAAEELETALKTKQPEEQIKLIVQHLTGLCRRVTADQPIS